MSDKIDSLVGVEVFSELKKLCEALKECEAEMSELITKTNGFRKAVENSSEIKTFLNTTKELNDAIDKINSATQKTIALNNEKAKEEERVAAFIRKECDELRRATSEHANHKRSTESLVNVLVEHQKKLQDVSSELKTHKKTLSESGKENKELSDKIMELTILEAKLKEQISSGSKEFKSRVTEMQNESTSINAMKAQLSSLVGEYNRLSEEQRGNSETGKQLKERISELNEAIKKAKPIASEGVRVYGEMTINLGSLRKEFVKVRNSAMSEMAALNELNKKIDEQKKKVDELKSNPQSEEYKDAKQQLDLLVKAQVETSTKMTEMQKKAGELKDMIGDTSDSIKAWASDTPQIDHFVTGLQTMSEGYTLVQASLAAVGIESETYCEILSRVKLIQNGVVAIQKIANALTQESIFKASLQNIAAQAKLAYLKAITKEETKGTAVEAANTAAEVANTKAKTANATATAGATAAAGALATGETVATTASFSLTAALRAVGAAISSIPIVGWLLAAVAAIAALGKWLFDILTAEKELTAEEKQKAEIAEKTNQIRVDAQASVEKENIILHNNIEMMRTLEEGSDGWNAALKDTAEALGVTEEWLKKNIDKVDDLADAWYNMKLQQALADGFAEASANKLIEAEQQIINVQGKGLDERNEAIDAIESLSEADKERWKKAEHAVRAGNETEKKEAEKTINEMKKKVRDYAKDVSNIFQQSAIDASKKAVEEGNALFDAQKESNNKGNGKQNKLSSSEANDRIKHMKDVNRKIAEIEAKSDSEIYALKQKKLKEDYEEELKKYGKKENDKLAIQKKYDLESQKLTDEYEKKSYDRVVAAEYDAINTVLSIREAQANRTIADDEKLVETLIQIEKDKNEQKERENAIAFEKEVENLDAHSAEYLAIKEKWDKKNEKETYESNQRIIDIRKKGFDQTIKDLQQQIKDNENKLTIDSVSSGMKDEDLQQKQQQLKIEGINAEIAAYQAKKDKLDELGITEQEYNSKMLELGAQLATAQKEQHDAEMERLEQQKEKRIELATAVVDTIVTIGNAIADGIEDEKKKVVVQQSLALAQVLLEQAVSIAKAIKIAIEGDPYTAAIRIAAAVAAVTASTVTAFNSIKEAKSVASEVSAYADGTNYHRGGAAVVGEGGSPELVITGSRSFVVDSPTLFPKLPIGSKVVPLTGTQSDTVDISSILSSMDELKHKEVVRINVGENVYSHIVKGASRTRIINRQFSH